MDLCYLGSSLATLPFAAHYFEIVPAGFFAYVILVQQHHSSKFSFSIISAGMFLGVTFYLNGALHALDLSKPFVTVW